MGPITAVLVGAFFVGVSLLVMWQRRRIRTDDLERATGLGKALAPGVRLDESMAGLSVRAHYTEARDKNQGSISIEIEGGELARRAPFQMERTSFGQRSLYRRGKRIDAAGWPEGTRIVSIAPNEAAVLLAQADVRAQGAALLMLAGVDSVRCTFDGRFAITVVVTEHPAPFVDAAVRSAVAFANAVAASGVRALASAGSEVPSSLSGAPSGAPVPISAGARDR